MKVALLGSIVLATAATVSAQVVSPPQTMTLTGCVGGGTRSQPITLSNALVLPGGSQEGSPIVAPVDPAIPVSPPPAGTSASATQPPQPAPPPASGTPGAVGTSGTIVGTAPAGSSASSIGGYRLSGADMTPWIGRRVQIVGTLVSSPTASSSAPSGPIGLSAAKSIALPEFHVLSVQPTTGPCPQPR